MIDFGSNIHYSYIHVIVNIKFHHKHYLVKARRSYLGFQVVDQTVLFVGNIYCGQFHDLRSLGLDWKIPHESNVAQLVQPHRQFVHENSPFCSAGLTVQAR